MAVDTSRVPEHGVLSVACPDCGAPVGWPCVAQCNQPRPPHAARELTAQQQAGGVQQFERLLDPVGVV